MKIAIVNSFFPPWRGGAETYTFNLARTLSLLGHDVTVLCANEPLAAATYFEGNVIVKRLQLTGRIYGTPIMPSLARELFTIDVDVFHANFPGPYIAFMVATASHIRRIPAVLTWHNDLPPVTTLAGVLVHTHDSAILPKYVKVYRRVIATSRIYVERSQILSRLGKLVTVIPNGVDCRRFNPNIERAELRTRLSLDEEFTLLFVGALTKWHRYKGLDVLLEATKAALERRRGLRLLVLGDGELRSEYQRIAAQLGLGENVCFLGDISDAELPEYYAASDALVLPSKDHSEGFGLAILEACASGKPVIASNVGGIASIVTHGYNGLLVQPNDPSSLVEATLHLSKNRRAALAMGRNGRKVAEAHDWKRTAALTEKAYLDALAA